jgi:glycosyltransferase involved in cell wall biosynthesis
MMDTETGPAGPGPGAGRERRIKLMLVTVGLGVGGTETQILEMASRLDRDRFDVLVCGLKRSDVVAEELRARGVRVSTLDGSGRGDVRVLNRLARLIRDERPDIIHAFLGFANLASSLVGRLLGVPVIIWSYRDVEVWKTRAHWLVERVALRWADAVTCCSDAVRRFVLAHVNGRAAKCSTIYNGVDPDRFGRSRAAGRAELSLREGGVVIGTVSRLDEPKKGLAVMLRALADLATRNDLPPWQWLVVGDGPARGRLQALAGELQLADRVVFAGLRHDVAPVLPLMDVVVCPSLYEGFGIVLVEAMAAGRPVIASATGGIPEIVAHEDTGLLVPAGDAAALAGALASLMTHPDRARAMGERGRARACDRFPISRAVERHQQLYESLWRRHAGPGGPMRGAEARGA